MGIETGNDNLVGAYNEIMEKMKKLNNLIDEPGQLVSDYNSATEDEKDDIQDNLTDLLSDVDTLAGEINC